MGGEINGITAIPIRSEMRQACIFGFGEFFADGLGKVLHLPGAAPSRAA
jgi:hypothetical protein